MAECGAEGELTQRCLGVKEQQNGELTDSELPVDERKQRDREERENLVLWKKPLLTLHYFTLELLITLKEWISRLWQQRQTVFGLLILLILLCIAYRVEGTHQKYVCYMEKKTLWCAYWVGLGILSSVGLGTGLHTFLLYLSICHQGVHCRTRVCLPSGAELETLKCVSSILLCLKAKLWCSKM